MRSTSKSITITLSDNLLILYLSDEDEDVY
jgi:hypothetical protein